MSLLLLLSGAPGQVGGFHKGGKSRYAGKRRRGSKFSLWEYETKKPSDMLEEDELILKVITKALEVGIIN
jgi:hypothetical protein